MVLSGPPLGGGVHRHNDVVFDDMSRTTGVTGVFVFVFLCLCCFVLWDSTGGLLPPRQLGEFELTMPRLCCLLAAFNKAWVPQRFCRIFFLLFFLA